MWRIILKHGMLQFQIQQGRVDTYWEVDNVMWKPVNDITEEIHAARLGTMLRGKTPKVKENEDFLVITIEENNGINFDDLQAPYGYVLTGVRFKLSDNTKEVSPKRVEISLIATEYNPDTGKLCTTCDKQIITSSVTHDKKYLMRQCPIQAQFPTVPVSGEGQYVVIDTSSVVGDKAQHTLPFFDALPLETQPSSAVAGLRLFHKTAGNFPGLVSLKFFIPDYTQHMENIMYH
ncbi:uncharacterized protein LOC107035891 isoform X2 [Diachasma alloeum]|uniref:uncharacterized protein LOC107035891 isoform X2 n=1 Tax=Diachasma alloeum TaxID=454923 RepID=UPI00073810E3|nr:uncharacterized protein LOC107035891 isoform X2 [Diachasma alloeum]